MHRPTLLANVVWGKFYWLLAFPEFSCPSSPINFSGDWGGISRSFGQFYKRHCLALKALFWVVILIPPFFFTGVLFFLKISMYESLVMLPLIKTKLPTPDAAKHLDTITLPPPCFPLTVKFFRISWISTHPWIWRHFKIFLAYQRILKQILNVSFYLSHLRMVFSQQYGICTPFFSVPVLLFGSKCFG